mgnify:CR=1 FL=1
MLSSTPVVAADIPSFRELAGDAALYFPPDDAPAFTFKPVEAGAATQVWAATAPELADHGGGH